MKTTSESAENKDMKRYVTENAQTNEYLQHFPHTMVILRCEWNGHTFEASGHSECGPDGHMGQGSGHDHRQGPGAQDAGRQDHALP